MDNTNIKEILHDTYLTDKFIKSNEKLIYKVIKSTFPTLLSSEELEDYIQEGRLSLYRAMLKYDDTKDTQFSTFACTYIRNDLLRRLRDNKHTFSLFKSNVDSLNAGTNEGNENELIDLIPSNDNYLNNVIENITKEQLIHKVSKHLKETDIKVLTSLVNTNKTNVQIAKDLGVSKQRISQRVQVIRNVIRELQIA